jgi:hypothetical protein
MKYGFPFLALIAAASCASKPKVYTPEMLELKNSSISYQGGNLSGAKLEDDIDFLKWALQRSYAGAEHLPPPQFSNLLTRLEEIKKSSSLSRSQLAAEIQKAFDAVDDAHIFVVSPRVPERRGIRKPSVGSNIYNGTPYLVKTMNVGEKKIGIVSITRFLPSQSQVWEAFKTDITNTINNSDVVIVDIRGNPGGDDARGFELAGVLYGQSAPSERVIVRKQTPESFTIYRNSLFNQIEEQKLLLKPVPENWLKRYTDMTAAIQEAKGGKYSPEQTYKKSSAILDLSLVPFRKIFILHDSGCGSSCESFLEAMEHHPRSLTVGENTAGVVHFGDVSPFQLPNSMIRIVAPIKYFTFPDKRNVEKKGYAPKIRVPAGQDAFDYVIDSLKKSD